MSSDEDDELGALLASATGADEPAALEEALQAAGIRHACGCPDGDPGSPRRRRDGTVRPKACREHATVMPMGAIQVKRVPEDLHEAVRDRASAEGMTVSDYVLCLVRRDLALPSRSEWFERVRGRRPAGGSSAAESVRAVRKERDAGLADASRRR